VIKINNVSKWYGTVQVLNDCSVVINEGDVVVACGPFWSGNERRCASLSAVQWQLVPLRNAA